MATIFDDIEAAENQSIELLNLIENTFERNEKRVPIGIRATIEEQREIFIKIKNLNSEIFWLKNRIKNIF